MKFDKDKLKQLFSKKHFKLIAVLALVLIMIGAGAKTFLSSKKTVSQKTVTAKKGDLSLTVSGSGQVSSTNESKLNAEVSAKVKNVYFKVGDTVKAGDVIVELDDKDVKTSVANSINGLEQSQVSAQSSYRNYNDLTIRAPYSGQVAKININQGDKISAGGTVLTISDTSKLKVLLSYNSNDASKISVGQSADVYLTSLMESIKGVVTYISNQPATTASGGLIYTVEIQMDNPGAVSEGTTVSADVSTGAGTVTSIGTGTVAYVNKQAVTSTTGGTIQNISVKENQKVTSGEVLVTIKNDDVATAKDIASLKIAASQNQVEASMIQSSKYKIVAPYDGTITKINYDPGDSVNLGSEIAIVSNPNAMQLDINVDELDIGSIAIGEKANITLDAISESSEAPMQGEVIKVGLAGTTTNGVTTYPVTIKFDGDVSKLKSGMNASADILVSTMKDVVYLPVEAVTNSGGKSYVWIKDSSKASSNQGYYTNAVKKEIKTGNKTNKYIAIESGLKEGEVVIIPQKAASNN